MQKYTLLFPWVKVLPLTFALKISFRFAKHHAPSTALIYSAVLLCLITSQGKILGLNTLEEF